MKLVDRLAPFAANGAICERTGGHVWPPLSVNPPTTYPTVEIPGWPPCPVVTTSECVYCGSTVGIETLQKVRRGK